jgi:hypothetical protein
VAHWSSNANSSAPESFRRKNAAPNFVILSEAKNLSLFCRAQTQERFFASLRMARIISHPRRRKTAAAIAPAIATAKYSRQWNSQRNRPKNSISL